METIIAKYTELLKNSAAQLDTLRAKLAQMTDMRDNTPGDDKWLHDDQIAFAKMRCVRLEERVICYRSFLYDIDK